MGRSIRAGGGRFRRLAGRLNATVIVYAVVGLELLGGVSWLCIEMASHVTGGTAILGVIVLVEAVGAVTVVLGC